MNKENLLYDLALDFSVRIVKLYSILQKKRNEYVMSKQILRSATSIGANIAEAQGSQSSADFITKLHISLKESRETEYWLLLLHRTEYLAVNEYESLKSDLDKIIGLLVIILKSTKENIKPKSLIP